MDMSICEKGEKRCVTKNGLLREKGHETIWSKRPKRKMYGKGGEGKRRKGDGNVVGG